MRNFVSFCIVASFCSVALPSRAKPLDEADSYSAELSSKVRQPVTAPLQGGAVDDYVISLGKSLHHNFILDAAAFPPDEYVQPFRATAQAIQRSYPSFFSSVLGDFVQAHEVAKLAYDDSTYLLWRRPEAVASARLFVGSERYQKAQTVQNPQRLALVTYDIFKQANPNLDAKPVVAELKQLPADVRSDYVAAVRRTLQQPSLHVERILSDDFWKTARVRVGSAPGQGGDSSTIYLGGEGVGGNSSLFFTPFQGEFGFEGRYRFPAEGTISAPVEAFAQEEQKLINKGETALSAPAPKDAPPAVDFVSVPPAMGLSWEQLSQEAAFKVPITADWRRVPLDQVLSEVGKKCGVTLDLDGAPRVQPLLITAHVEALDSATLLGALARLYLMQWEKSAGKTFVLKPRPLDDFQKALLRSADGTLLRQDRVDESVKDRIQRIYELKQDVLSELAALRVPAHQEASLSVLSEGLQQNLKSEAQYWAAVNVLDYMASYMLLRPDTKIFLQRTLATSGEVFLLKASYQSPASVTANTAGSVIPGFIVRAVPAPVDKDVMRGPGAARFNNAP